MMGLLYRLADAARRRVRTKRLPAEHVAGRTGEDLAHRYLEKEGLRVVARNYRPRSGNGEIDLVAWDGDILVFVEVKTRLSDDHGSPDRAIDSEKRSQIERGAADYARRAKVDRGQVRFDVINVLLSSPVRIWRIRDAFRWNGKL